MGRKRGVPFATDIQKYIGLFPELEYTGTHIQCIFCNIGLLVRDISDCRKHLKSKRHIANTTNEVPYWKFLYDFTFMLSVCDIPQHVVDNTNFRRFWTQYVPSWKLPSRKQLRNSLPRVQEIVENFVKEELRNHRIWLTVDETTSADNKNRVVNVVARTLKSTGPSFPFLLCSKKVTAISTETVVQLVRDIATKFDLTQMQVVMLVSDASPYMLESGKILKIYYPNLLHITCLLHLLHFLAEIIRLKHTLTDSFIVHTQKVFAKSPKFVHQFKKLCPEIPVPLQHVLAKGGTWLEAVVYYNKYFQQMKYFILTINSQECESILVSRQLFWNNQVAMEVAEISEKYSVIVEAISQLQNSKLSLVESLNIVDNLEIALESLPDTSGLHLVERFRAILNQNPDFQQIRCLSQCISDNEQCKNNLNNYFKFASITSLDVQRSFCKYTKAFSPFRRRLSESTMEGLLMLDLYASSFPQLIHEQ